MFKTIRRATMHYSTHLINLLCTALATEEIHQCKFGWQYSFVDKTKHIKKHSVTHSESMADKITYNFDRAKEKILPNFCVYM